MKEISKLQKIPSMKVKKFKWFATISLMAIFFGIYFLTNVYSHKKLIDEVNFKPPNPKPESTLKLYISLFPSKQEKKKILIELFAWRDLNHDFMYTELGEEIDKRIDITDNEEGDEELREDEIIVSIFDVPKDGPPQKYTAIVTFGKDKKSSSIIVPRPRNENAIVKGPNNLPPITGWLSCITYDLALKLQRLKNGIRNGREARKEIVDEYKIYKGKSNDYIYHLSDGKLEIIIKGKDSLLLSPVWSFDNKRIALIVNKNGKWRVAWTDIRNKKLQIVTEGPDDRDPVWMPDGKHILFLKNGNLRLVDVDTKQERILESSNQIDRILGVAKSSENGIQVIYEAPNPYTSETKEIYMLELDTNFARKSHAMLVNDPSWFLFGAISPSGDKVVYSDANNNLFISQIDGKKPERLFENNYQCYEPCWSPDGDKITFVSNHP